MAIFKKSTPRPSRSEAKSSMRPEGAKLKQETEITPDHKDGTAPFIRRYDEASKIEAGIDAEQKEEGQLAVDVFQTADEIVIVAPVAGVKSEDLAINITDEVLTIRGSRDFQFSADKNDYFTQECFWGGFSRSIILPESIDASRVKASFKNGILTLRIPKIEKLKTRMVRITEE